MCVFIVRYFHDINISRYFVIFHWGEIIKMILDVGFIDLFSYTYTSFSSTVVLLLPIISSRKNFFLGGGIF